MSIRFAVSSPNKGLEKLEALILCLAERAPDIGITKLEKLMYLCDFEAAKTLGKPISEDTYRNFQWGPVPKHFVPALDFLVREKQMTKTEITLASGRKFTELVPAKKCEQAAFTKEEWQIIESVLGEHARKTAAQLVELTHKELTWKLTKRNEEIPYFLAHYRNYQKPSARELDALFRDPDYIKSITEQLAERVAR
jgi:uncharacterized phage-associated protein